MEKSRGIPLWVPAAVGTHKGMPLLFEKIQKIPQNNIWGLLRPLDKLGSLFYGIIRPSA